jgi:hypothetical protein
VSHNLWFLWLILGLKLPLIGLFYFIFRVMRARTAWEQGELDGGWSDDDSGGGGEPRIKPPPPPGGPGVRRRKPRPRAPAAGSARAALARSPRRRAEPPHPRPASGAGTHGLLSFDDDSMRFLILGSGPAGYAAASTAAALGAEGTIVDRMALGGNWTMTDGIRRRRCCRSPRRWRRSSEPSRAVWSSSTGARASISYVPRRTRASSASTSLGACASGST